MLLLAAFQTLLARYTGQTDIVVGTPIANRTRTELEGLIGFFVNTLVLRGDLSGNPSFRELLRRVRECTLGAYAHQDVPFEKLVEELQPERVLNRNPLFQVMLVLQNAPGSGGGGEPGTWPVGTGTAKFDLTLFVMEGGGNLTGAVEYSTDLFDAERIRRLTGHFQKLLEGVVADAGRGVWDLPLLTEPERRQLLVDWNPRVGEAAAESVIQRIEEQAARTPGAVAVEGETGRWTYEELNAAANRLTHYLRRLGVGPEARVGICLERSPEMVLAVLGVVKAGATYVPLDAKWKPARMASILANTAPALVLTSIVLKDAFDDVSAQVGCIEAIVTESAKESADNPATRPAPHDLVCILPACGPANRPACAALTHRQLARLAADERLAQDHRDIVALISALDAPESLHEIWLSLASGARLAIPQKDPELAPQEFAAQLRERAVTVAHLDAARFQRVAEAVPAGFSSLRRVVVSGENPAAALAEVKRKGAPLRLLANYGPAECCGAAWLSLSALVTAGSAVAGTRLHILDARMQPLPTGIPGEIYLGGHALGGGYYNDPRRTALYFVPDPFSRTAGARLYRTGDRGRLRQDGTLELLGRSDRECRFRSASRFDCSEIEAELCRQEKVAAAAVGIYQSANGDRRLAAWLVPSGRQLPTSSELRKELRRTLPDYMAPAAMILVDALPRLRDGRVDYAALPSLEQGRPDLTAQFQPAATPVEKTVARIWAAVFGLERIGRHDNFFQLGGHSLLATQVIARISDTFQTPVPLRQIFLSPTVAGLSRYLEAHREKPHGLQAPAVLPAPRAGDPPLSFSQERLWFLDQWEPASPFYNVSSALRLPGPLSAPVLEKSLNEVVRRHEILRTIFVNVEGRPAQRIAPYAECRLELVDLQLYAANEREAEAARQARMEAWRHFDLANGPLIRAVLLRLSPDDHILLLTLHHIVSDGWSMGVLFGELSALYDAYSSNRPSPLPELELQYADFAQWQRQWLTGEVLQKHVEWWRRQLEGAPPALELPADRPRPAALSFRGGSRMFTLPAGLSQDLQRFSQREGVTLFMTLLAAFQTLLARYSGQRDIVVGTPIANRSRTELETLIGFFVNTLVLRTDLGGDPSFRELLARVRETTLWAYAHQDLPFEKLVEELQPERVPNRNPLFQVMLVLQNAPTTRGAFGAPPPAGPQIDPGTSRFDLVLAFVETAEGLWGGVEYSRDLFDEDRIERLIEHFETLLAAAIREPERRISELAMLSEAEQHQVLTEWNETRKDYARACLHQLIEAQVARTPEAPALVFEGGRWTYAELNSRANRLAHYLRGRGVGPESLVGVCLERSPEMVVALLAILKAGGAYVPLDPDYPAERIAYMREDARCALVLDAALLEAESDAIAGQSVANLRASSHPDNLAYVIYTSGSTGRPKGAMNTHAAIVNRLLWMQDAYALDPADRVLQKTPFSFDVSVWEFFWPLMTGARLVLARPGGHKDCAYLARLIGSEGITTLHFVPSMLEAFLQEEDLLECGSLRRVFCSGEALSFDLQGRFYARIEVQLYNLYGPTEAAVDVTAWTCPRTPERQCVPIGRPIANLRTYIVDRDLRPVPVGVPGELCLGGIGVGRGYSNNPALTADSFIPDPFGNSPGQRLYRTGDLCSWLPDGEIEYLGRIDSQVKIRGFRVEPGELESLAREHPAIEEAVVIARKDPACGPQLVCYAIPHARYAGPVRRLLSLDRESGFDPNWEIELPNGMTVLGRNRAEVEFQYREMYERRGYLRAGIALPPDAYLMDVGANIGMFSLFASREAERVHIYAFEPIPEVFRALEQNTRVYGIDAHCFECGLGSEAGQSTFTWYSRLSILSGRYTGAEDEREAVRSAIRSQARERGEEISAETLEAVLSESLRGETLTCAMTTLSEVIRSQSIPRIDLLKIDVEKSEMDVLAGIENAHWPLIRQIAMEVHDLAGRRDAIVSLLRARGFETVVERDPSLEDTPLCHVYARRHDVAVNAPPVYRPEYRWSSKRRLLDDLEAFLKQKLPEYLRPSRIVLLDRWPLLPNGKLDRRALADADPGASSRKAFVQPRGPVEELLAELWAGLLAVDRVGAGDDFFSLGGHSLLATRVISWIRQVLGIDLPLRRMFEEPTVAGLADALCNAADRESIGMTARALLQNAGNDSIAVETGVQ
jgi:amino acid adenylation domain-containing protein/FkbM family methyltransferase